MLLLMTLLGFGALTFCFSFLFFFVSNVISAMGIRPHPLFLFTRSLFVEDPVALLQCIQSLQASGNFSSFIC
jgi:hypothetical protein